MKITNDAQAVAARRIIESFSGCYMSDAMREEFEAALAEYEARQIELTEDELAYLRYADMNSSGVTPYFDVKRSLFQKGFIVDKTEPIITPEGRAYLDAHKPRELKWEVWNKTTNSLRCSCDDIGIAETICKWHNEHLNVFTYEVREVK